MTEISVELVRQLLRAQCPQWADLALVKVEPGGWDHRSFRLGETMVVRLPSAARYRFQVTKEYEYLPRLCQRLRFEIPKPIFLGRGNDQFPWPWSVSLWIKGVDLNHAWPMLNEVERHALVTDLASFLKEFWSLKTFGKLSPSCENFYRGGSLSHYRAETQEALSLVQDGKLRNKLAQLWHKAEKSSLERTAASVWVHGDVNPGNLLLRDKKLAAIIDFGALSHGDPACDLTMRWTHFCGERGKYFESSLSTEVDSQTWLRSAAWALWKLSIQWRSEEDSRSVLSVTVIQEILNADFD